MGPALRWAPAGAERWPLGRLGRCAGAGQRPRRLRGAVVDGVYHRSPEYRTPELVTADGNLRNGRHLGRRRRRRYRRRSAWLRGDRERRERVARGGISAPGGGDSSAPTRDAIAEVNRSAIREGLRSAATRAKGILSTATERRSSLVGDTSTAGSDTRSVLNPGSPRRTVDKRDYPSHSGGSTGTPTPVRDRPRRDDGEVPDFV
ncbi:unnamed protein product [Lota lota]